MEMNDMKTQRMFRSALIPLTALALLVALFVLFAGGATPVVAADNIEWQQTQGNHPMTHTMPMTPTAPPTMNHQMHHSQGMMAGEQGMMGKGSMRQSGNDNPMVRMGRHMQMMGMMMQMMGHMRGMMDEMPMMPGMGMESGMMQGTMPMTHTMPMTGAMAMDEGMDMDMMGMGAMHGMMGQMMEEMMGMMSEMHHMHEMHGMMHSMMDGQNGPAMDHAMPITETMTMTQ
jgi:hypothetical protein